MDLRQLYSFACLYEERSVTRAALRLNIVQPALSMQIAKLEEEIGQKLFDRSSQGMIPTPAEHTMHRLFMPILRDFSHARQQMALKSTNGFYLSQGLLHGSPFPFSYSNRWHFPCQRPQSAVRPRWTR